MNELIIQELQRLSKELNKTPTRDEFVKLNTYSISKRKVTQYFSTYSAAIEAAGLEFNIDIRNKGSVKTECAHCQQEIIKQNSEIKKSKNVFCSHSCSASFNNKKNLRAGGKYVPIEKTCLNCNNLYTKDGRDTTNTCSQLCLMELGMKQRILKDSIKRKRIEHL